MMPSTAASLATWISQVGLVVADETEFLSQLYARACARGQPDRLAKLDEISIGSASSPPASARHRQP
jgi:hypothetical protein